MSEELAVAEPHSVNGGALVMHAPSFTPAAIIEPPRRGIFLNLRELWQYRELFYFLVWRDVKVRYKQTVLGIAWAVLQPVLTMLLFNVLFGRFGGMRSSGVPYPIFVYTALLPWQLLAHSLAESGNSLVANQRLITRVYFPRLVIPVSAVLPGLLDFAIAFVVLGGMMFYYRIAPTWTALAVVLFILLAVATAVAAGLWLSALNVRYRDVRYVIPFLTQFWFFATPIAYSSHLLPASWRSLYGLNPMAGVVEGFRWALLGKAEGLGPVVIVSVLTSGVLLLGGLVYFRSMEQWFADIV